MRLILTTIILTMLAQPVWAASTYACSSGLAIVAQLDSVKETVRYKVYAIVGDIDFEWFHFRINKLTVRNTRNLFCETCVGC